MILNRRFLYVAMTKEVSSYGNRQKIFSVNEHTEIILLYVDEK